MVLLAVPSWAGASTFSTILNFNTANGAKPAAGLIQAGDGNFYGTTAGGGSSSAGTVFQLTPAGTLNTLVNFSGTNGAGAIPHGGVIQGSDGNFYGTTYFGGSSGYGTIFQLTANGAGFTLNTLVNFNSADGANPAAGLIQGKDGNFYGTTPFGGSANEGTAFQLIPNGPGFTLNTLVTFNFNNGANPYGGLIQGSDGNFYGTTSSVSISGSNSFGSAFKMTTGGTLTSLATFSGANGDYPNASLIQGSDGNFYGTTYYGGSLGYGTVFQLTPAGALTTVVNFTSANGANPYAGLIQASDGNFYGTTYYGGSSGYGTVFQLTPNGAGFTLNTLVNFNSTNGANPLPGLIQGRDGGLYGTTSAGGAVNVGTVFRFNPAATENVTFASASTIPIVASAYTITGSTLNLTLNFVPAPGTVLTVIHITGGSPISGTFSNLPNGGTITATYNGGSYTFTANYSGGSGDDLTLTLTSYPTDTPLLPPWAWLFLIIGLFLAGSRRPRPVGSGQA
jgi:uncharacterized repeat protein (TIGR03803 family)